MLFLEGAARPLLVLHAVLGAATVAVATHLVLWTRKALRGQGRRLAGLRWFGAVLFGLFALQFAAGNLLYPTYKVRVRGEHLDLPHAAQGELRARAAARAELAAREGHTEAPEEPAGGDEPIQLPRIARLFDVKEHLVALALPFAFAACALAFVWKPERDGATPGRLLYGCAVVVAATVWFAAIVGVVVASYRAVG